MIIRFLRSKKKEYRKKKKEKERLERRQRWEDKVISSVMKKTGWDYDHARDSIESARRETGCTYKEYKLYRFYRMTDEEQRGFFVMDLSKKLGHIYNKDQEFVNLVCDKAESNRLFAGYMGRPWCVNNSVSLDEFREIFKGVSRIIYKPVGGNCGKGVSAYDISEDNIEDIYHELYDFPAGVVEQYLVQHPELSSLAPDSVNTVRIVTVSSKDFPVNDNGDHFDIAYAALRIGGESSVVDNFHSGGMVAAVDLQTGKVITNAVDVRGKVYREHPVTGKKINGFVIPMFDEILDMAKAACGDIEGYLGWDIAVTENGPVLIEVNTKPAVALLQMPYVPKRKGMKHVMKKYLDICPEDYDRRKEIE